MSELRYRLLDAALARGALPEPLLRAGSLYGAWARQRHEERGGIAAQDERLTALLERMRSGPIAEHPEKANEQQYDLPPDFFASMLGPRRKYSACLWTPGTTTLAQSEERMLTLSCQRASIRDGMRILDLGCGWGSLSLWLAERYPAARVTAVSNSDSQGAFIEREIERRGLGNLRAITADVNDFQPQHRFHRVVSIEMFEHMRNWRELLRRISGWLVDDGRLFLHVFSHRTLAYRFEDTWASERFFNAGLMPSHELIAQFQDHMLVERRWALPGIHYARTLGAWLARLDEHRNEALAVLQSTGRTAREAQALFASWRLFLLSTREIWAWKAGERWLVSHYRLAPRVR